MTAMARSGKTRQATLPENQSHRGHERGVKSPFRGQRNGTVAAPDAMTAGRAA